MDEEVETVAPAPPLTKQEQASKIYTDWRNAHLNEIPVEMFNRLEAASSHLIEEIAARL